MSKHPSNSTEHQKAEALMLTLLEANLGLKFDRDARLPILIGVQPDAVNLKHKVVVEAYAHIGAAKGGQLHKIKGDILKLVFIEKELNEGWRKIMCFASEDAAKYAQGKSWAAEAARAFGIEIHVVPLTREQRNAIKSAQKRQNMVNTT
jgi:hypothetical protein